MKKIIILLIILFLFTGCGKKLTIRETFLDNSYIDIGDEFVYTEMSSKLAYIYVFDLDSKNNYFAYNLDQKTGTYYYNKGLMSMNECYYNTDDGSYTDTCTDDEISFLKETLSKFKEENKKMGLSLERLKADTKGLD